MGVIAGFAARGWLVTGCIHSPVRRAGYVCPARIPLISQRSSVGGAHHTERGSLADWSRIAGFSGILARDLRLIVSTATP